ncbi:MAG: A/G-specific adenine glycosylase [Pseudomonadota bacterium]
MKPENLVNVKSLLDWYDAHARIMPWRVSPSDRAMGIVPDPYQVWLSEVMLQQTTVAAVKSYFIAFMHRWPRVEDLADAKDEDVMSAWAGLGYYARARNLLRCARVVKNEYDGVFPSNQEDLLKLPGIGPYTAAAIAAIAFDQPATVLDGNVERVMSRVYAVLEPLPKSKEHLRGLAKALTPAERPGDYAQAVMDLGATICTPRSPNCTACPWSKRCKAYEMGIAADLPKKLPKRAKPTRYGHAFILRNANARVVMERRPEKGLLGGMLGWPGDTWAEVQKPSDPPIASAWTTATNPVIHIFTHFRLELSVHVAKADKDMPLLENFEWHDISDVRGMPTVMQKAWKAATAEFGDLG